MQVVPKYNTQSRIDRVTAIKRVRRTETGNDKRERNKDRFPSNDNTSLETEKSLDGHTLIAAQVIATRYDTALNYGAMTSRGLEANSAYAASLERKVHRMTAGSFLEEAS